MADEVCASMQSEHFPRDEDGVKDQATAWVMRLTSGKATREDAQALQRWQDEDPRHRQAFAETKLLWEVLGSAAEEVAQRQESTADRRQFAPSPLGRRAFFGGALAASAAAAAYFGSKPPFLLWPSVRELRADYRTGVGEQRRVTLADDVSLVLNTQTSVGIRSSDSRAVELISGEAAVTANTTTVAAVDIVAAGGRVTASVATFDMRCDGANVQVTCLDGAVEVSRHDRSVTVPFGHRVTYDARGLGPVSPSDVAVTMAWQQGLLIFRHQPLAQVIAEVNRYRPGRIVLLDDALGRRDVVASFHLNRIDDVVAHVVRVFGAHATALPGGVVVLS